MISSCFNIFNYVGKIISDFQLWFIFILSYIKYRVFEIIIMVKKSIVSILGFIIFKFSDRFSVWFAAFKSVNETYFSLNLSLKDSKIFKFRFFFVLLHFFWFGFKFAFVKSINEPNFNLYQPQSWPWSCPQNLSCLAWLCLQQNQCSQFNPEYAILLPGLALVWAQTEVCQFLNPNVILRFVLSKAEIVGLDLFNKKTHICLSISELVK